MYNFFGQKKIYELRIFFPVSPIINVGGWGYNRTTNRGEQMTEIETELYALMAECEAEGVKGSSTDEGTDPRLERIGNLLSVLQVVDWEGYKRLVLAKFNVPEDYFED